MGKAASECVSSGLGKVGLPYQKQVPLQRVVMRLPDMTIEHMHQLLF